MSSIFNGAPSGVAPAATVSTGIDTVNGVEYFSTSGTAGWLPVTDTIAKAQALAQVADNANVLTFVTPVTAVYALSAYEVIANSGVSAATLAGVVVTYTDADTSASATVSFASVGSAATGTTNQGTLNFRPKVGTNIVVSTSGYVAGTGTQAFNIYVRLAYVG
jgi:hypothetical protein